MKTPYGIDKNLSQIEINTAFSKLTSALNTGKDLDMEALWIFSSGLAQHGSTSPQNLLDLGDQIVMHFGWPNAGIVLEGIMESGDLAFFRKTVTALKKSGRPSIADFVGRRRITELQSEGRITSEMMNLYDEAGRGIDWA